MSSLLYRICQLSKATLRAIKPSSELFTYMFFLVLSGLIWLSVALNEYYEREVALPVLITGVPESVAIDSGAEDTVHVVIRDKGFTFLYYLRTYTIEPIPIDFKTYKKQNGHVTVSNTELRRLIKQYLEDTSTLGTIKPEHLDYTYSQSVSKVVPVRISGNIGTAENYYLAQTIINPNKVTIYLSKSLADSVKYVTTERIEVKNLSDTTAIEAKLVPIRGVTMSKKKVKVHLYADILTEEEVDVPITAINVPSDASLRFFPSHVKIKFVAGVSLCKTITPDQFAVQADYNQIEPGSDKCAITISQKPHGVMKATTEVDKVDYLIEY